MKTAEHLKPCDFEKWVAVPKWKLSEAACILSGYEPSASALASYESSLISIILAKNYEEMCFEIENNDDISARQETWIEYAKQSRVLSEINENKIADSKKNRELQAQQLRKAQRLRSLEEDNEFDDGDFNDDEIAVEHKRIQLVMWEAPVKEDSCKTKQTLPVDEQTALRVPSSIKNLCDQPLKSTTVKRGKFKDLLHENSIADYENNPDIIFDLIRTVELAAEGAGEPIDRNNMPGIRKELYELAQTIDSSKYNYALSTFYDLIELKVHFKSGSRRTGFYKKLFPMHFKLE